MRIIDLTHTIREDMPVYPGTRPPCLTTANTYEKDGFRETLLQMFSHTGTHMDAPAHLFGNRTTLDAFTAGQFVGKGLAVNCRMLKAGEKITMERLSHVRELADQAEFLLFSTGWESHWGKPEYFGEYPCIDLEVAQYLIDSGKKGVGLDTIGIDPISDSKLTIHRQLFSTSEMVIVENLVNLDKVGEGPFTFCALPLKFIHSDGAPVRAIAILDQ